LSVAPAGTMASIFQSFPLLRKAAPSLSKEFFTCRNHRAARLQPSKRLFHPSLRASPFFQLRYQTTQVPRHATIPTFNASEAIAKATSKTKRAFFPETSEKKVAYWLLGSAASVFGIVIFGGLTRLTESGYVLEFDRLALSVGEISGGQYSKGRY
jgi:cytochrome c oxidase assembly protein subunit 15